jgi:hypothetical protein
MSKFYVPSSDSSSEEDLTYETLEVKSRYLYQNSPSPIFSILLEEFFKKMEKKRRIFKEAMKSEYFAQLPLDSCISCPQRNRYIPRYTYCAMCGNDKNLQNHKSLPCNYGGITLFCRHTNCYDNYGRCLGVNNVDLSNGVPFMWTQVKNNPELFCQEAERVRDSTGFAIGLTCDYCGVQSGVKGARVISHPRVPIKYGATSFCKNSICYSSFTYYVDSIASQRVPFAFLVKKKDAVTNTVSTTVKVKSDKDNNCDIKKKRNTKNVSLSQKKHSHSLTFHLPIVVERDDTVHKDVCLWCPCTDNSLKSFNDILLGAFCDFVQIDENVIGLFKKVKCSQ